MTQSNPPSIRRDLPESRPVSSVRVMLQPRALFAALMLLAGAVWLAIGGSHTVPILLVIFGGIRLRRALRQRPGAPGSELADARAPAAGLPQPLTPEQETVKKIRRALTKCQYLPNLEDAQVEKALGQLDQASERFAGFRTLLGERFDPGELTYGRYLNAAEQVFLCLLDHLDKAATLFNSLSGIDGRAIEEKLETLTPAEETEIRALRERLALRDRMRSELSSLLGFNEKAVTELIQVSTAVAAMNTGRNRASVDLDTAIDELSELAKRAGRYSSS